MLIIIDDYQPNLDLMRLLALRFYTGPIHLFQDPVKALDFCKTVEPDLILIDYLMPHMSGLTCIEQLKTIPSCKESLMIMVTATDSLDVRRHALALGATDFLTKPFDAIEYSLRVKNLLQLRSIQKNLNQKVREAVNIIELQEISMITTVAQAAEYRDPETGAHTQRVGYYAQCLSRHLGLSEEYCHKILYAAPLHDLGKIGIPDAILLKPGKYTPEEFEVMKSHALIGYKIAARSEMESMKLAASIALTHHEKWDGSGYPNGLAGDAIPMEGLIVAVADVFDALTSSRPYKKAWPVEVARDWMVRQKGLHFSPLVIDTFVAYFSEILAIKQTFPD